MEPRPATDQAGTDDAAGRCARPLDALNFLLADVRGARGPFLNVYLVSERHWTQSAVGLMTTIAGLLGIVVQTPIGGAIDATWAKRGAIVAALAVLALGAATLFVLPEFWPVTLANAAMAIVGDVFGPAVAALTLGLTTRAALARRLGRNSAFDHAGNVAIALAVGAVGYAVSQRAVFLLVPVFALAAIVAVLSIPHGAIDQDRARGLDEPGGTARRMARRRARRFRARRAARGRAPRRRACLRARRRATARCCARARCWCSACAPRCSISPTRRCCRWSGRSWRPRTRASPTR